MFMGRPLFFLIDYKLGARIVSGTNNLLYTYCLSKVADPKFIKDET
jgi:hypothetical protein